MRKTHLTRRGVAGGVLAVLLGLTLHQGPAEAAGLTQRIAAIEARSGGRLGAALHDTATGRRWTYRADERFPLNSTFKAFACAAVLAQVDAGTARLDEHLAIPAGDLVPHSPVTQKNTADGMRLGDLCAAATAVSDNTAANLILARIGGPEGLTQFMRCMGDDTTRLDRTEPDVNEATPGDPRDTTTPRAAAASLEKFVLGDALSPASRAQLIAWMEANTVSAKLLRAVVPPDWRVADRTGAGGHGARSIIAVAWPPGRPPVVLAIYLAQTRLDLAGRDAVIAEVAQALVADGL